VLISRKQVAAKLGVSRDMVETLTNKGELIGFLIGARWKYFESDVDDYLNRLRYDSIQRNAAARSKPGTYRPRLDKGVEPVWKPGMKIQDVCADNLV